MDTLSEIFLCNLQLSHQRGLLYPVEHRCVRFTGLEVERTVLCLQYHIITEQSVFGFKLCHSLFHPVFSLVFIAIHEATPHDNTSVWFDGIGKYVCPVGMLAVIVAWSGLTLRVSLHKEASEVGNNLINLLSLVLPPLCHLRIERVGGLQSSKSHRRCKIHRQIGLNAIGTKNVGNGFHLIYIYRGKHLWRGIHVVEHRTIDTYRGICPGIFRDMLPQRRR